MALEKIFSAVACIMNEGGTLFETPVRVLASRFAGPEESGWVGVGIVVSHQPLSLSCQQMLSPGTMLGAGGKTNNLVDLGKRDTRRVLTMEQRIS